MKNVIVTGGGGAAGPELHRRLGHRYRVFLADANPELIDPDVPNHDRLSVPYGTDPDFATKFHQLCTDKAIDYVLPGVDEELLPLSDLSASIDKPVFYLPRKAVIQTCIDKVSLISFLESKGINVPPTATMAEASQWTDFPAIVKPRLGRGSRGVFKIDSHQQFAGYMQLFAQAPTAIAVQQWLSGVEYTVFVGSGRRNNMHMIVPLKVLKKRGITIDAVVDYNTKVVEYCRLIQEVLQPHGPLNVQLILHEDQPYVIEINPRISTTFFVSLAGGYDPLPAFDLDALAEDPLPPEAGLRLLRHWKNHLSMTEGT